MVERKPTRLGATAARDADARGAPTRNEAEGSAAPRAAGKPASEDETQLTVAPPVDALVISDTCWVPPTAVRFTFSRSSGPGGQAVNKVNTRAQLRVAVNDIVGLSDRARSRLRRAAGQRLTAEGEIIIQSDEHRSQRQNREECLERLRVLVAGALVEPRKRKKTRPSKASKERRLKEKKRQSEKKQTRRGGME